MLKEYGQDLKKLRESKDITLAEISAQTRINQKFLNNIEEGNFDFQPETYIRSFLKAYARVIDESEKIILNDYDKAKSGFYARRKFVQPPAEPNEDKISIQVKEDEPKKLSAPEPKQAPVYRKDLKEETSYQTSYEKYKDRDDEGNGFSHKTWTQKILLGLLILVVLAAVAYLIYYLNNTGDKKNSNVKPQQFNENYNDYKNKITGKKSDSLNQKDSISALGTDSLRLMVKVSKDTRIKAYIDENRIIEEDISAKDSLLLKAKDQFRFSATGNSGVELYLNGKFLKKPVSTSGLNSIKNLIIKKDGIVSQ